MIDTLYIEEEVADHPRTRGVQRRFPQAQVVYCRRYSEVFNRKGQDFRLQKARPALILARKHQGHVLPVPEGYGVGGTYNFYFSHMLNCLYDCRYCFLQGMYRSAHYLLYVNYEDFDQAMDCQRAGTPGESWFFSGYDCDSLALEPVTGFAEHVLEFFARRPDAWLELRTKSTQIRSLLARPALANCVVAYSLTPDPVARALEHRAPPLERRLEALTRLQQAGWPVGLRFDPLIWRDDYQTVYAEFFEQVFRRVEASAVHSVSLGPFRLPRGFYRNLVRLYPEEALFAGPLGEARGQVGYPASRERALVDFCSEQVLKYIPEQRFFPCGVEL